VCLLNASATGTETLKNLVLPGVGHITIVDAARVTPRDVASNFFVAPEHLGTSRAQVGVPRLAHARARAHAHLCPLARPRAASPRPPSRCCSR
jgi:molybdopterin/thiamine biosynthesis adenylyltransferase